ncbi:aaa atpase domain-containing protein, partial [Nannochloropsis gaditana CCMP526]|uniref:aaa atpase domain-containing protein n=1 Tax=Nannochloropsis gaditana (strain CCMP526) TaxID=1093141 RepID=UPI00029F72DD
SGNHVGQIHVLAEGKLPGRRLQDGASAARVGGIPQVQESVEAAGAQQGGIQEVRAVRRTDDKDVLSPRFSLPP